MGLQSRRQKTVIDPDDRISRLPEEIQAHILSFLPAQEAVQTCVLACIWRHVWKSTRRLLITGTPVHEVFEFVDRLLRVRLDGLNAASLDACEIKFDYFNVLDFEDYLDRDDISRIKEWIRLVLKCQIQVLRINMFHYADNYQLVNDRVLVSQHLTRLELTRVELGCRCLNLVGCPVLEHLEINQCWLDGVRKMTSLSLKHLIIGYCHDREDGQKRMQICVPRLVSLWLDFNNIRTPILERMPELVGAKVGINSYDDMCECDDPIACYHITRDGDTSDIDSDSDDDKEDSGDYAGQNTINCVVLEGLAQAKDLVLIADRPTYIFRRDLRWCPTFSNLKTLLLYDDSWWQPADCSALACILEHAPLLEELTINSYKFLSKYKVEMEGHPDATLELRKRSKHLKTVYINCDLVDERFLNVLNFLRLMSICFVIRVTERYS